MALGITAAYLIHLEAEGKTKPTLNWYRGCMGKFSDWLETTEYGTDPEAWSANTIRAYLVALKGMTKPNGEPLSATSVASYARALRAFCHWLHEEEYTTKNLMERVKPPTPPKLVKPVFSAEECQSLLKAAKQSRLPLRDEAILLFLLDTGARANELCGLKEGEIQWNQRLAKLYGKGQKERYVPFSAATLKAMQRYSLKARKDEEEAFFQSDIGMQLSTSGLRQLCERLGSVAGVDANPHKFRHTFAISYLRSGASVFALQKTLGHETLTMTLRYSSLATDDLVNDHAKHSPVASLVIGKR